MHSNATSQIKQVRAQPPGTPHSRPSHCHQSFAKTSALPRPNHSFEHYSNVRERRLLCYVWLSIQIMFPCFPVPRFPPPAKLVLRFPVLRFPPLRFGPSFSSPAFSSPAFSASPKTFTLIEFQYETIAVRNLQA